MVQSLIFTLKPDCSDEEVQKFKDSIKNAGGKITNEYTLIKGFSCELPDEHIETFSSRPYVQDVEKDQEVRTQ
ncbi:hypothetical protein BJ508DRAFT_322136 [Ascobolus immersus RN42]|uniref:Inhibitor I9 domain-containing protein n=1 Tax=Ascobolus immersus RN42 TaxID=1160509 RepID=A0A3N4IJI1_ASCIM|nr:hypothetical protein BJ508DRAFT_322136 [Ascobolus immersus RN42]